MKISNTLTMCLVLYNWISTNCFLGFICWGCYCKGYCCQTFCCHGHCCQSLCRQSCWSQSYCKSCWYSCTAAGCCPLTSWSPICSTAFNRSRGVQLKTTHTSQDTTTKEPQQLCWRVQHICEVHSEQSSDLSQLQETPVHEGSEHGCAHGECDAGPHFNGGQGALPTDSWGR